MLESVGCDEWPEILAFMAECDLPDGFFVAGRVSATAAGLVDGKASPRDFVPFYGLTPPPKASPGGVFRAFQRVAQTVAAVNNARKGPGVGQQ